MGGTTPNADLYDARAIITEEARQWFYNSGYQAPSRLGKTNWSGGVLVNRGIGLVAGIGMRVALVSLASPFVSERERSGAVKNIARVTFCNGNVVAWVGGIRGGGVRPAEPRARGSQVDWNKVEPKFLKVELCPERVLGQQQLCD